MIFEPQSIIVYRNPLEQQFWESGLLFPIMVACAVAILVAVIAGKIIESSRRLRYSVYGGYAVMILSTGAAIGVLYKML